MEPSHQTLESFGGALEDSAGDFGLQARFSLAVPERMAQQQLTAGGAGQLLTVSAKLQPHGTGLSSSDLDLQSSDSDLQSFDSDLQSSDSDLQSSGSDLHCSVSEH